MYVVCMYICLNYVYERERVRTCVCLFRLCVPCRRSLRWMHILSRDGVVSIGDSNKAGLMIRRDVMEGVLRSRRTDRDCCASVNQSIKGIHPAQMPHAYAGAKGEATSRHHQTGGGELWVAKWRRLDGRGLRTSRSAGVAQGIEMYFS